MPTRSPARFVAAALVFAGFLDPASAQAARRRAFVTSVAVHGSSSYWPATGATALERADSVCRARAAIGGLPNADSYRAWLSTSTTDAYCHVQGLAGKKATGCGGAAQPGGGPWFLRNGVAAFTGTLADLTGPAREIYRPVLLDEHGDELPGVAYWTGTEPDGTASAQTCQDWSSSAPPPHPSGTVGLSTHAGGHWTSVYSAFCAYSQRLLCLEPGASEVGLPAWSPSAIVFVTSQTGSGQLASWPEAQGEAAIAAGDAICRTLAGRAGLPRPDTFVAWLSASLFDAADRITTNGPFRRLDGFAIANSKADLLDGVVANALVVDEHGRYLSDSSPVWTGTGGDGLLNGPHCQSWTSGLVSQSGARGDFDAARSAAWTQSSSAACSGAGHLYCFQNVVTAELPLFADGFETGSVTRWSATVGD